MFKAEELLKAAQGKLISGSSGLRIKGISIDSRTIKNDEAFIAIKGVNFDGHNFINEAISKGAKAVITQIPISRLPALPLRQAGGRGESRIPQDIPVILVKDTLKALGDIARLIRREYAIPVIAVTGSNGKTTTKEMIARVLSGEFNALKNEGTKNNQIGLPLALLNLKSSHELAVLELGTNHPGEIKYLAGLCLPNIAVITNIGPAHLEYFGSLKGVFKEKRALIENLIKPRTAVLNADDDILRKSFSARIKAPVIFSFGIRKKSDFSASAIKISEKIEFLVNQKYKFTLNTPGYYNIYNALAAIAVGRLFGVGYRDIAAGLAGFDFPPGRLKFITSGGLRFIDDTYNSNPASLKQALDTLNGFKAKGRKIFVMGDMLELGGSGELFHRRIGKEIRRYCDIFIAVGDLSKTAAEAAAVSGFGRKNIFTCQSSSRARNILFNKIAPKKNDIVLVKGSRAMRMEEIFK